MCWAHEFNGGDCMYSKGKIEGMLEAVKDRERGVPYAGFAGARSAAGPAYGADRGYKPQTYG